MSSSGKRLLPATVVLAVMLALTVWQFNSREGEETKPPEVTAKLPKISKDAVDDLEITPAGKPGVKLSKQGKTWMLSAPVVAAADQSAVESALDKLSQIEVVGVAATQAANHTLLEVDDAHALHVVAKQGGKIVADLLLGTYRSGNTMVREKSSLLVASVKGSIKYAFEKEVKEWRDRNIADVDPDHVKDVVFRNANGMFRFVLEGNEWKQAPGDKPIPNFDAAQVKSMVASAARMTAVDFAPNDTQRDAAGVGATPEGLVTLTTGGDAGVQQIVLRIGKKLDQNYYLVRDGNDPIYLVSSFVGERLIPSLAKFAKEEPKPAAAAPAPGGPMQMPPGMMPMMGGRPMVMPAGHPNNR
ncbi:MAG TPA: DUF4340 domain-containing protein [Polyangiales bacterium]